jgi:alanine-glyoxylate transaminase / serine-glyoxylate transaminase / serine-pyruvate transaminase
MLQGLKVALDMLREEGLDRLRAPRPGRGGHPRRGPALGLRDPVPQRGRVLVVAHRRAPARGPFGGRARAEILERSNMSLGNGLGRLADRVFRIGHLGDFHDLMVTGTISGVEMGLAARGIPHRSGGVEAALRVLQGNNEPAVSAAE